MKSNRSRLLFVVGSLAALASLRAVAGPNGIGKDPATKALSIFSDVFSLTRANYVEPADSKILLEGAYDGMSDALDAFSYYVPAAERAAHKTHQTSGATGSGIVVARRGGFPFVVAPLPGSPAEKMGVEAGDLIDSIDGKSVRNAPLWRLKAALEGPDGTHVAVVLFRAGDEKKLTLSIPRRRFEPVPLSVRWEKDVAIARVPSFAPATAESLRKVLEEASSRSVARLVLDLRGSIGGDVADAASPAGLFTGKGLVARLVSRKAASQPLEAAGEKIWKGRTVILTDNATAGPAEVFAAALRDRAGVTVVGETTVGMAIVQRLVPTESGGGLFMTVGRYLSPSGAVLGGKGLSPDERVVVFPGDGDEKDQILERGLEVVREEASARRAA
jgi:carboxyl-terminal processing protease